MAGSVLASVCYSTLPQVLLIRLYEASSAHYEHNVHWNESMMKNVLVQHLIKQLLHDTEIFQFWKRKKKVNSCFLGLVLAVTVAWFYTAYGNVILFNSH